jgi:hypothetical protein
LIVIKVIQVDLDGFGWEVLSGSSCPEEDDGTGKCIGEARVGEGLISLISFPVGGALWMPHVQSHCTEKRAAIGLKVPG